jgi:hypothetical protein
MHRLGDPRLAGNFWGNLSADLSARATGSPLKKQRERERERDINAIEIDDLRDEKWKCNGDSLHRNIIFNSIVTFR